MGSCYQTQSLDQFSGTCLSFKPHGSACLYFPATPGYPPPLGFIRQVSLCSPGCPEHTVDQAGLHLR